MDQAPDLIDHTVVAMDLTGAPGDDAVLTIVMRDVGESLVPPGDATVPAAQHARFIAHMAALSSVFWGWEDQLGLTTMAQRMRFFAPDNIAAELDAAVVPGPLAPPRRVARPGRTVAVAVRLRRGCVHDDPAIITGRLSGCRARSCTATGRWATSGSHPDGRTVLLDWTLPGAGPACWDLCWYLALNRARLPEQKEAAIGRFRAALESHGIATAAWLQEQLDLCLIGDHGHVRLGEGARRCR